MEETQAQHGTRKTGNGVGEDRRIEPSGTRVVLHGVTVAEFDGDKVCSVRQYWDELAVLEQLGAVARER